MGKTGEDDPDGDGIICAITLYKTGSRFWNTKTMPTYNGFEPIHHAKVTFNAANFLVQDKKHRECKFFYGAVPNLHTFSCASCLTMRQNCSF